MLVGRRQRFAPESNKRILLVVVVGLPFGGGGDENEIDFCC